MIIPNLRHMGKQRLHINHQPKWRQVHFPSFSFMILPLSFKEALNRSTTQFPQSKQRLPKLRFLLKLGCQKPCWDQARLCLAWKINKLCSEQQLTISPTPPLKVF